ncbi:MAG: prepilin-type N-terminal cleavage/methylation domain-containing protein [Nitrososphaeria archaeon]
MSSIFSILLKQSFKKIDLKNKGFTLMEMLIYSSILVVTAGMISGIVSLITKSNLKIEAENEITQQLNIIEEIFRQKIESAQDANIFGTPGNTLQLTINNATTTFYLNNNILIMQDNLGNQYYLNDVSRIKINSLNFTSMGVSGVNISGNYHYAWSDNIGWIDFAYPGGNIKVPVGAGDFLGAAYVLANNSWISLNCLTTNDCSVSPYKVSSDTNGNLSGWAWSESFGWISFSSSTDGSTINYGVKVATTTTASYQAGEFDGYAWSDNIGWISFNCKTGGSNQSNICSTSDYRVQNLQSSTLAVKVDLTVQYNSSRPEQQITKTVTYVYNLLNTGK